jgi:serine/threonine protein kinase
MTALTATGQVIAGRYELTRFIAGGAMGEVWEAHDERMQRTVAVKVLRPEYARDPVAVARFLTEARLAARLAHPGIAQVHDVDNGDSSNVLPWMVQEFVPGRPLSQLVARSGGLDPFRSAGLIAQAADAVHAAHLVEVVHRDLTSGNLLVCDGDVVKITDFGIARASGAPALTATGEVVGSAAYLSPEQVSGQAASPASDIYALGVLLYECLAGARPFTGANPVEIARAHLTEQPPSLRDSIPERLRAITAEAMAKDPADRPRSAAELASRLREVIDLHATPEPSRDQHTWDWFVSSSASTASPETRPLPRIEPAQAAAATAEPPPAAVPEPSPAIVAKPAPAVVAKARMGLAPPSTRAQVPRGAAAVRLATQRPKWPAAVDAAAMPKPTPAFRRVGKFWQRHPVSMIGLTGAVVILLVVLAVLWSGTRANAAPGIDMPGSGAGTVRVGSEMGKGAE